MNLDDGRIPAIVLTGPTAAGKTALAVALVEEFPCDIISVDSAMVYRGMDIGTAKPDAETLARAPHRLIDILDPAESYSAARFRQDALREMHDVAARGRIPLLVGGTMLYLRALQHGLADLPAADSKIRRDIAKEAAGRGWPALHAELARIDPDAAKRIHPNDPQRIQRALEVYRLTRRPLTELYSAQSVQSSAYRFITLAVAPANRDTLHQRIAQRFDAMLEAGFVEEVKRLCERSDLRSDCPSMRAVGYRQIRACLDGRYDLNEARKRGIVATRQLAKRQLTWLRSLRDVTWFKADTPDISSRLVRRVGQALESRGG